MGVLALATAQGLPCLSAGASVKIHGMTNARALVLLACLLTPPLHSATAQGTRDGEWTMPAKDYASTRYSGLTEITRRMRHGCIRCGLSPPACSAGTRGSRSS